MTWRSQILSNRVCPGMAFPAAAVVAARLRTPSSLEVGDNAVRRKERPQRGPESLLLLLLIDLAAPALLLGLEEGGEELADGALGDVAGDEHHAALAVVALGPGVERGRGMEDVLHAVDHDRLVGVLDVQDALHAQEVGAAIGHQRIEPPPHPRPDHLLLAGA